MLIRGLCFCIIVFGFAARAVAEHVPSLDQQIADARQQLAAAEQTWNHARAMEPIAKAQTLAALHATPAMRQADGELAFAQAVVLRCGEDCSEKNSADADTAYMAIHDRIERAEQDALNQDQGYLHASIQVSEGARRISELQKQIQDLIVKRMTLGVKLLRFGDGPPPDPSGLMGYVQSHLVGRTTPATHPTEAAVPRDSR